MLVTGCLAGLYRAPDQALDLVLNAPCAFLHSKPKSLLREFRTDYFIKRNAGRIDQSITTETPLAILCASVCGPVLPCACVCVYVCPSSAGCIWVDSSLSIMGRHNGLEAKLRWPNGPEHNTCKQQAT